MECQIRSRQIFSIARWDNHASTRRFRISYFLETFQRTAALAADLGHRTSTPWSVTVLTVRFTSDVLQKKLLRGEKRAQSPDGPPGRWLKRLREQTDVGSAGERIPRTGRPGLDESP